MRVYYYQDVPNFGDMLNKYMWNSFFPEAMARTDDWLMFGIGTLIGSKVKHDGRIVVFGSGVGYQGRPRDVLNYGIVSFVRGPLSAHVLGLPAEKGITDPAILAPEVFPAAPKTDKVIFIPHWETAYNPLWRRACEIAGITYVDPLADVREVIAAISSARLVVTEAMHGAILADAYRVPWVPVSTSPRINLFKWNDWAQSLNMAAPEFNFFGMMGVSDFIRAAIHDAATMKEIASYVDKGANPAIGQIEHEQGGLLVRMSNWMLENLVPKRFRYGVDRLLMSKIGPACDHVLNRLAALGLVMPGVRRNARKLAELSKLPGTLSGEDICAVRRRQIHERIAELNQQLAADYQQKTVSPS